MIAGNSGLVTAPNDGEPTRADMQEKIDELQDRHFADQELIGKLEEQQQVDQDLIAHLEAEGVLDQVKIANLETALITARRIGAAMGILMARQHVTDQRAFQLLRDVSQATHRKLRDVAEDVILTGILHSSPS